MPSWIRRVRRAPGSCRADPDPEASIAVSRQPRLCVPAVAKRRAARRLTGSNEKTPPASKQVGRWCAPRETRSPDERQLPPAPDPSCRRPLAMRAGPPGIRPSIDVNARGSPANGAHAGIVAPRPLVRSACVASYRPDWRSLFMRLNACFQPAAVHFDGSDRTVETKNRAADVHPRARFGQVGPAAGSPRGGSAGGPSSIGTRLPGAQSLNATRSGCQEGIFSRSVQLIARERPSSVHPRGRSGCPITRSGRPPCRGPSALPRRLAAP